MLEHTSMKQQIEKFAKKLGFDLVGFTPAKIDNNYFKIFKEWLSRGFNADMSYMNKIKERADLKKILPNAKSVIVLATNYYRDKPPLKKDYGIIARYAYGRDYHKVIGKKLKQLEKFIKESDPKAKTKSYIDTGPILERALAKQAGLGFLGKNSTLITSEFGSWVFLSEIITTLDIAPSIPSQKSKFHSRPFPLCANCTRCIDACPTGAIIKPGVIDARLCISYLTIENKGKIPQHLAKIIAETKQIFGCDICQEVCPHNHARQRSTTHRSLKIAGHQLPLRKIRNIKTDQQFLETFAGSPLMRAKRTGLQRNTSILIKFF